MSQVKIWTKKWVLTDHGAFKVKRTNQLSFAAQQWRHFTSEIFMLTSPRRSSLRSSQPSDQSYRFVFAAMSSLVVHWATPMSTSNNQLMVRIHFLSDYTRSIAVCNSGHVLFSLSSIFVLFRRTFMVFFSEATFRSGQSDGEAKISWWKIVTGFAWI